MQTCQAWIWHNLWTWAVKGTWKVKKSSMELTVPTYHGVLLSNPSFCVFNAPGLFYRQRPAHLEVNYYVKHLVQDTDGGFNQGLEWIVEGQLLKTEGKEGSLKGSWKVNVSLSMVQVADYRLEDGGVSQVSGRSFGTSALQTSMYEVKMSMNSYTNHNVNTYPWYSNLNLTLTWQMTWNPSNRWSLNVPQEWFRVQGSHVLNCRWGDLCTYISPFLWTYAIVGQRLPHVSSSQFCFALACFFPRTRGAKIWLLSVHQVRNIRNARFWGVMKLLQSEDPLKTMAHAKIRLHIPKLFQAKTQRSFVMMWWCSSQTCFGRAWLDISSCWAGNVGFQLSVLWSLSYPKYSHLLSLRANQVRWRRV